MWEDPAGPQALERVHTEGYRLFVDPLRFNGNYHLHYYPRLAERLDQFRPDILHMDEEPYNVATWLGVRQAKARGIPSLFFSWQNINQIYPPPFRWMEKWVLQNVDYALFGTESAAGVARSKGYRGPDRVIPQFGVDPDLFHPPARRDAGRVLTIGAAGRLVPEKGLDILLTRRPGYPASGGCTLPAKGPEERPGTAGGGAGHRRARCFRWGDSGHGDARHRASWTFSFYPRTRPRWKEQFGRILIEAMASEVAVIGAASGEIPNVIGEAGLVFPEGDAEALRGCLQRLLQEPGLRDRLGTRGRERVLQSYTQARVAAATVDVYRSLVKESR